MMKASLIQAVSHRLSVTTVEGEIGVEAVIGRLVAALPQGEEVEIRGFGSFRFRNRAARRGRNPKTGARVDVPAKKVIFFKMGKELSAQLCQESVDELAGS